MTALEFEAVVYGQNVYCVSCLPPQVSLDNPDVIPIYADRVWDKAPVCSECGRSHDYASVEDSPGLLVAESGIIEKINKDKVSELIAEIKMGVASIHTSEDWKRWLEFNSRFWTYSFNNQMLIAIQRPTATRVAGFHTWKDCNRRVKKGERGIKILAPIIIKTSVKDEETGEERIVKALRNFKIVTVFDIDQTEGERLPSLHKPLQGIAPSGVFESLKKLIERKGYSVSFKELPKGLYGYVDNSKQIVLKEYESEAQTLDTLCHEMSHAVLGHLDSNVPEDDQELEAETSAWIICKNLGLETRQSSFTYLAGWSAGKDRDTKLERAARRGCDAAREILGGLAILEMPDSCPVKH